MMFGRKKKQLEENEEERLLSERQAALDKEAEQLKHLLEEVPMRAQRRLEEQRRLDEEAMLTIPPPDEIPQREREKKFYESLSRGKVRNQKKEAAGSLFLLLVLLSALVFTGLWVMRVYTGN